MKFAAAKIIILASVASGAGTLRADENLPVRNCTWCHGTSAQGFSTAPRLAGQQPRYTESQLLSFSAHIRDNPLSQQYMWGAAANLSPEMSRDLAVYFSALHPKPPMMATRSSYPWDGQYTSRGFLMPMLCLASFATDQMPKESGIFRAWEDWHTPI
jgi:cytochrome c553